MTESKSLCCFLLVVGAMAQAAPVQLSQPVKNQTLASDVLATSTAGALTQTSAPIGQPPNPYMIWLPQLWESYNGSVWVDDYYDPNTNQYYSGYLPSSIGGVSGWYFTDYITRPMRMRRADDWMYQGMPGYSPFQISDYSQSINNLFQQQTGRPASAFEIEEWSLVLDSGYISWNTLAEHVANYPESIQYRADQAQPDDRIWLANTYFELTGKIAASDVIESYISEMNSGLTRVQIRDALTSTFEAVAYKTSKEVVAYKATLDAYEQQRWANTVIEIAKIYQRYLKRAPSNVESDHYTYKLHTSGTRSQTPYEAYWEIVYAVAGGNEARTLEAAKSDAERFNEYLSFIHSNFNTNLGRSPNSTEIDSVLKLLLGGVIQPRITHLIAASPEAQTYEYSQQPLPEWSDYAPRQGFSAWPDSSIFLAPDRAAYIGVAEINNGLIPPLQFPTHRINQTASTSGATGSGGVLVDRLSAAVQNVLGTVGVAVSPDLAAITGPEVDRIAGTVLQNDQVQSVLGAGSANAYVVINGQRPVSYSQFNPQFRVLTGVDSSGAPVVNANGPVTTVLVTYGADSFGPDGYDAEGFDVFGYDRGGYDRAGYSRAGMNSAGLTKADVEAVDVAIWQAPNGGYQDEYGNWVPNSNYENLPGATDISGSSPGRVGTPATVVVNGRKQTIWLHDPFTADKLATIGYSLSNSPEIPKNHNMYDPAKMFPLNKAQMRFVIEEGPNSVKLKATIKTWTSKNNLEEVKAAISSYFSQSYTENGITYSFEFTLIPEAKWYQADFILNHIWPPGTRSWASPNGEVKLPLTADAFTYAHEFAHAVLGIMDAYREVDLHGLASGGGILRLGVSFPGYENHLMGMGGAYPAADIKKYILSLKARRP